MNNYSFKIQYVYESLSLMKILSQPSPFIRNIMFKRADEYEIVPGPSEEKYVEELQLIEDEAREDFSQDTDEIKNYFFTKDPNDYSFAEILLLHIGVCTIFDALSDNISIRDYQKYLKDLPPEKYNNYFYQMVRKIGSKTSYDDGKESANISDIFDAIYETDLDDSDKLKLQQFYIHRHEHIEKIFPMLLRAAKIIKKHEKTLEAYGKRTIAYTKEEVKDESFIDYIMKKMSFGDSCIDCSNECTINISYLNCNKIGLIISGDSIKIAHPIAQIGAIFSESLTFDKVMMSRRTITQEKALTLLKLLSDKSKLEILELTKSESNYGAQLANKLGLTTATISHHTSALFEQNLLHIEKVDSKVYYKENKDKIRSLIKYLEDTLL